MILALVICVLVAVALACVALMGGSGQSDEERVTEYFAGRRCALLRMKAQLVPAFFGGEKKVGLHGGVVYDVTYEDAEDRIHVAVCETSPSLGVLLRRDGVLDEGPWSDSGAKNLEDGNDLKDGRDLRHENDLRDE